MTQEKLDVTPDVSMPVIEHMGHSSDTGFALWLTGMSGAGKSTLASALHREFLQRRRRCEVLDGDELRATISQGLGFSRADRDAHIRRVGYMSRLLSRNGVIVIVAAIAPFRDARREVRESHETPFVEVWVDCSLDELVRRDCKGLYVRALRGEIEEFTGVSQSYEAPDCSEITVCTHLEPIEQSLAKILNGLEVRGLLPPRQLTEQ